MIQGKKSHSNFMTVCKIWKNVNFNWLICALQHHYHKADYLHIHSCFWTHYFCTETMMCINVWQDQPQYLCLYSWEKVILTQLQLVNYISKIIMLPILRNCIIAMKFCFFYYVAWYNMTISLIQNFISISTWKLEMCHQNVSATWI